MEDFSTIGLVARVANDQIRETLLRAEVFLRDQGAVVVFESSSADMLGNEASEISDLSSLGSVCDLVVAVGGDGNILSTARAVAPYGVPVLGINQGKLGFLADISPDDIEKQIREVLSGNYTSEEHFLLEGEAEGQGGLVGH